MMANKKILLLEKDSRFWRFLFGWGRTVLAPGSGVPEKSLDITDLSLADSKAYEFTADVASLIVKNKYVENANSVLGSKDADAIFKKAIGNALKDIFLSIIYVKKVANSPGLGRETYFIPKNIDIDIWDALVRAGGADRGSFNMPRGFMLLKRLENLVKCFKARIILYFFPELIFCFSPFGKKHLNGKRSYKYGIFLRLTDAGISQKANSMDFLIKAGIVKKEDALFVMDGTSGVIDGQYLSAVASSGYDYCSFAEMIRSMSRKDYLEYIYPILKKAVKAFRKTRAKSYLVLNEYNSILNVIRKWEAFYLNYDVRAFVGVQEPGAAARTLWQRTHGSRYCFIYLSSNIMKYVATKTYYSNIVADKLISSMMPLREFKEQKNHIGEYCDVGVLNADIVRNIRADNGKSDGIRSFLNIERGQKVAAVFDDNSDSYDTMPIREVKKFLEILLRLLDASVDTVYVYKPRALTVFDRDPKIKDLYLKIKAHEKCRLVVDNKISALEIMAVSDAVLTVPLSSSFTEALSSGLNTVCFVGQNYMTEPFDDGSPYAERILASDYNGIHEQISAGGQRYAPEELVEHFVKRHVDRFCDGKAFDRLRECMAEGVN